MFGDDRGFRTRHHREHVEGDYRNSPPGGVYDVVRSQATESMQRKAVVLTADQRVAGCYRFTEALLFYGFELIDLCVTATHVHVLVRFDNSDQSPATPVAGSVNLVHFNDSPQERRGLYRPEHKAIKVPRGQALADARDSLPRYAIGRAKSWTSKHVAGDVIGGLFAVRSKQIPVKDQGHQCNVLKYIREHAVQDGAVLSVLMEQGVVRF